MLAHLQLNDPIRLAIAALGVLIWAFAAFVAFNSLQRRRTDYAGVFEGRWFYAIPQAAFVAAFVIWQMPWVPDTITWMRDFYIALPIVLAQQMAYLLRVVFPTSKRLEKRLDAECAALREADEEEASAPVAARPQDDSFFDPENPDD